VRADDEELQMNVMPGSADRIEQGGKGDVGVVVELDLVAGADGEGVHLEGDAAEVVPRRGGDVGFLIAAGRLVGTRRVLRIVGNVAELLSPQRPGQVLVSEHPEQQRAEQRNHHDHAPGQGRDRLAFVEDDPWNEDEDEDHLDEDTQGVEGPVDGDLRESRIHRTPYLSKASVASMPPRTASRTAFSACTLSHARWSASVSASRGTTTTPSSSATTRSPGRKTTPSSSTATSRSMTRWRSLLS